MNDCLFCKIAAKEIPSDAVYEDEHVFAFRDINPQAPCHVLVIPKKHITHLADAQPEDQAVLGHLMLICANIARMDGVEASGYRVALNTNRHAGQSVYHLHAHVLGGREMGWPPG